MLYSYMIELGYTEEDIKIIVEDYSLNGYAEETLYNKIKDIFVFLLNNGYSREEVIKMTKKTTYHL